MNGGICTFYCGECGKREEFFGCSRDAISDARSYGWKIVEPPYGETWEDSAIQICPACNKEGTSEAA